MANETQTNSASSTIPSLVESAVIVPFREQFIMAPMTYMVDLTNSPGLTSAMPTLSTTISATAITSGANEANAQSNTQLTTSSVSVTAASKAAGVLLSRLLQSAATFDIKAVAKAEIGRALGQKLEVDLCTLLGGHTNTVGTSGVDCTVENWRSAIITLRTNGQEHAGNAVGVLHPVQVGDVEKELMSGVGSGLSSIFTRKDVANIFGEAGSSLLNSYLGDFLGVPIFMTTNVQTANSNADRAGAFFIASAGNSPYCAYMMAMKWLPRIEEFNAGVNIQLADQLLGSIAYGVAELNDTLGVSVITDA